MLFCTKCICLPISKSSANTSSGLLYRHSTPMGGCLLCAAPLLTTRGSCEATKSPCARARIQECLSASPHLCDFPSMRLCLHVYAWRRLTKKRVCMRTAGVWSEWLQCLSHGTCCVCCSCCSGAPERQSDVLPLSWGESISGISQSVVIFLLYPENSWVIAKNIFLKKTLIY